MNKLRFSHSENMLHCCGKTFHASCDVRNELNSRRNRREVVETYPINGDRKPYYPRPFPTGLWEVKKPVWTDNVEFWPVKIPTSATQIVPIWETDSFGYDKISDEVQEDAFYHLHHAKNSKTTLGCIRITSAEDARYIARRVEEHLEAGEKVYLEVVL